MLELKLLLSALFSAAPAADESGKRGRLVEEEAELLHQPLLPDEALIQSFASIHPPEYC